MHLFSQFVCDFHFLTLFLFTAEDVHLGNAVAELWFAFSTLSVKLGLAMLQWVANLSNVTEECWETTSTVGQGLRLLLRLLEKSLQRHTNGAYYR